MSTWYTCNLGDAMLAGASLEQIKAQFLAAFDEATGAKDMAVFFRHESEGRLHCELKVYFTPAAGSVARAMGAIPCHQPSANELALLAGAEEAWAHYFPAG
ncbi:MAG TPA: hypothetical protein VIU93_13910 [Gallionellaceae bacterium]